MPFKTVLPIDEEKLIEDEEGNYFLKIEDLEKLLESSEEYTLLTFLKESHYITFPDFPALGASKTILTKSFIEGPLTFPLKVKEKVGECYSKKFVYKIFPSNELPASFEKIKLINYGIRSGPDFNHVLRNKINEKKVEDIVKKSLEELEKFSTHHNVFKDPLRGTICQAEIEGCMAEFRYVEDAFYHPIVHLSVLGKGDKPHKVINMISINQLQDVFTKLWDVRLGLESCVQQGLAYNLSNKEIDLNELKEYNNIIL